MNRRLNFLGLLCAGLFLQACSSSNELSTADSSGFYGSDQLQIEPDIKIYHLSADSTIVYLKFDTENLLYVKDGDQYRASVIVEIEPTSRLSETAPSLEKKTVSIPPIPEAKKGNTALASATIYLPKGNDYKVAIDILDESNGKSAEKLILAEKNEKSDRENFLILEAGDSIPEFGDRIKPQTTYSLEVNSLNTDRVFVNYYNRSFPLPPPPFAYYEPKPFNYSPDDQFTLESDDSGRFQFTSAKEGFYHFRVDTTVKEGFTLFVSSDEFPEVQNVQNMIDPFRYLVSGKEYKQLLEAPELKNEIEKFWINWAGDRTRARDNIEAYYNRVEKANRLFSSHLEGWKSDRGLIFIIYGEPDKVYKNEELESWIYGEERNPLSINFRFIKVDNPFTENDFRLSREDYYKPSWYRYIEAWRNGRIY